MIICGGMQTSIQGRKSKSYLVTSHLHKHIKDTVPTENSHVLMLSSQAVNSMHM